MAMKQIERALRPDFVTYMTERDAWPLARNFEKWIRENGNGIKNGVYGAMTQGRPVHPKFIAALARYLRDVAPKPEQEARRAFTDFLTRSAIDNLQKYSPEELASFLCASEGDLDYHDNAFAKILDLFNIERFVGESVQECVDPQQVSMMPP